MYHGVVARPLDVDCWHQLPRETFARQMAWVARRYAVLPLEEALAGLAAGTLPDRALALTFDDGYRNVRTVAGPVLAAHGLHATVFLVTDLVGTEEVVWADRLYLAFARSAVATVDVPDLGLAVRDRHAGTQGPRVRDERPGAQGAAGRREGRAPRRAARGARPAGARGAGRLPAARLGRRGCDAARGAVVGFAGHSTRHEILARMPDGQVAAAIGRSHDEVATSHRATCRPCSRTRTDAPWTSTTARAPR